MTSNHPSSRIRFRSPLLQAPPKVESLGRVTRLTRRWVFLGISGFVFALVIFFLLVQPYGRNGPGWPLYWLHDTVYLPFKGYTFTLYHPSSWIWWGLIFTLAILWTLSFATDRSLILRSHVALLKTAVNSPTFSRVLLALARRLARPHSSARLLFGMVERERQIALHQLWDRADASQCNQVAHLTGLLIKLNLAKPNSLTEADYAKAAVCWHEAFLQLERQAKEYGVEVELAQKRLCAILPDIVVPLRKMSEKDRADIIAAPSAFDLHGLFIELVALVQKGHGSLQGILSPLNLQPLSELWFVEAVDQRRAALIEAQRVLMQSQRLEELKPGSVVDSQELTWFIGQLAMSLAIHVALFVKRAEIGLAYLDAVEAVKFALSWSPVDENLFICKWAGLSGTILPGCREPGSSIVVLVDQPKLRQYISRVKRSLTRIATFVGLHRENNFPLEQWQELPHVEHYRCLADLSKRKYSQLRSESKPLLDSATPLLVERDLALGDERNEHLYLASGLAPNNSALLPDFDPDRVPSAVFNHASINLSLFQRIDAALLALGAGVFSALLIFWFLTVQTADILHLFEAPVVSKIEDERILINVRDNLPGTPFLDAVLHNDKSVYVSQTGGLIHRYDPSTGLWSYERPQPGEGLSNHNYVLLRSGCGDDPRSEMAESCPDPDVLWAVTESGGLARRNGRSWEVVVGDAAFRSASGRFMSSQDLTTAAVSDDDRWLVVGTAEDGFGVYNLQTHSWLTLSDSLMAGLPSQSITRMVWWQGYFWLAGPRGLVSLVIYGSQPVLADVPVVRGEIIDLDIGPDGGLWVLANVACDADGDNCLFLSKLNHPNQPPESIITQRNNYSALNLARLIFAQYSDDKLTLAGEAGIYLYDPVSHSWQRLFVPAVWSVLPDDDNEGFFFAYHEGIGLVRDEVITTWDTPEQDIVKLLYDHNNVLALSQEGDLLALSGFPLTITKVFVGMQTSFEPEQFVNAVGTSDQVLLISGKGALLHNTSHRTYEDIEGRFVPGWLHNSTTRLLNAGANIYALSPSTDGGASVRALPARQFMTADFFTGGGIQEVTVQSTSGDILQSWPWNQDIGILQSDGIVDRFTPQNQYREVGAALTGFDDPTIVDVTELKDNLVIALPFGLVTYDQANRTLEQTASYNDVQAIESFDNALLFVTEQGQLLRHDVPNPVNMIGASEGFAISDAAISDALLEQHDLYLAGDGRVERYDTNLRRVAERWDFPGQGSVRLVGIVGDKPVTLASGRAAWGDNELPGDGVVVSISLDSSYIWTTHENSNGRYLMGYPRHNPLSSAEARCYFRNPSAGSINQIQDARALPNGHIAVATDSGLRFYNSVARSWFLGPEAILPNGGRLYLLDDFLLAVTYAQDRLWLIPISGIRMPGSCTSDRVVLQDVMAINTRAVTINEDAHQLAWITPEEAVFQWQNGKSAEALPAVSEGPDTDEIRRVYKRGNRLFFTTTNGLWRYDLAQRRWQQISLQFDSSVAAIAAINLESYGTGETIVVQDQNGSFFLGTFSVDDTSIAMMPIFTPPTDTFGGTATSLLDVQQRSAMLWTFVGDDRIRYYDPQKRQWKSSVSLGQADPTQSFEIAFQRGVLVGHGGQTWQVAHNQATEPTSFARFELQANETTYLDNDATIWRWLPDGSIWRCPLPDESDYTCMQTHSSFRLDSDQVRRAFGWHDLLLFETDRGFVALNTVSEEAAILPDELASWPPGSSVRQYDSQLWLHLRGSLLILRLDADAQLEVRQFDNISQLSFDSDGRPWAQFGDQWHYWSESDFVAPINLTNVFVLEKTPVTAVDSAGYPYWWEGEFVRDDFVLPPGIDLPRLAGLWRGSERDWWALVDTQLYHVTEGICHPTTLIPFVTPTPLPAAIVPTGTPLPTLQIPVLKPTTTLTVTATPAPVACFLVAGQIDITSHWNSATSILQAEVANNTLDLTLEGDWNLRVQGQDRRLQVVLQQTTGWQLSGLAQDRWPLVRGNMSALPNGDEAYNPIINLITNSSGELMAIRPQKSLRLADQATNQFDLPSPLDVSWLRWNRSPRDFSVQTPSGMINLSRQEVVIDGQLIFEGTLAALAESPNNIYLANEHGLWLHHNSDLRLDDAGVVYQPVALGRSIEAAHGRFLVAAGDLFPGDAAVRPPQPSTTVEFGDITLTESIRNRRVTAAGITGVSIFTDRGFIWDRDRRSLGYRDGGLQLQSDAGVHPLVALTDFDAGPDQLARGSAVLYYEAAHGLFLHAGNTWYRHSADGWRMESSNPSANRVLLSNSSWEWRVIDDAFQVNLAGATHDFDYPTAENNFTFSSDRLMAAATYHSELYLMTEAFFEIANNPDQIGAFSATRLAPLEVDSLETFRFADDSTALYRYTGEDVSRWTGANQQFVTISPSEDPRERRELVRNEWLHLTYDRQQSIAVTKQVKVEHIQQGQYWVVFGFEQGLFPFDIVTAIFSHQNRLYVGSRAGLQVYADTNTSLDGLLHLYDLRSSPTLETFAPVESVGVPRDNPDLIMSRSVAGCIQNDGGGWAFCSDASLLDWRLRINTALWQWLVQPDDQVIGRYYDYQGTLIPDPIIVKDGRFPHDQLQAVSICRGQAFTLLQNGWLTISADDSLRLQGMQVFSALSDQDLRRFICIEDELPLPSTDVPAGLYLESGRDASTIWEYERGQWQQLISESERLALIERADFPPAWEQSRLRLLFPQGERPFTFQQRDLGNIWHDLSWERGRLAIDRWHQLLVVDSKLWAATPDGLVSFERNQAGQAVLDLDTFLVVREPGAPLCHITDIQQEKGEVWVRCQADSNQVYQGRLDGHSDRDIFTMTLTDPFVEQTYVRAEETGYWEFQLTGRALGSPGSLRAWLHGEELQLIGGQFSFDTINSLAFLSDVPINVGTIEAGWFQIPLDSWHVQEWQRPSIYGLSPQQVSHVSVTQTSTDQALCLQQVDGSYLRLLPNEGVVETASCPEYLIDDDLWRYWQEDGRLLITAQVSVGGMGWREMVDGRFVDDVIVGLPSTGQDGQGIFYLIPTRAGVIRRDSGGQHLALHVGPFSGLVTPPTSVMLLEREKPIYIGADGLYTLDNTRELYLALTLPENVIPLMADFDLDGFLRIRWRDHAQFGWTLVNLNNGQAASANLMAVDVSQYGKYIANYEQWGAPEPWMSVHVGRDEIHFLAAGAPDLSEPLGTQFDMLVPILHKDRLILIGRQELLSVNLEYGLVKTISLSYLPKNN